MAEGVSGRGTERYGKIQKGLGRKKKDEKRVPRVREKEENWYLRKRSQKM